MPDPDFKIIALDGGAASGKSSTSRGVAKRLNYLYVNSGAHYRTMTYFMLEAGINHRSDEEIQAALDKLTLSTQVEGNSSIMHINGEACAGEIITSPEINANVSLFAAKRPIRSFLLEFQRAQVEVAREHNFKGIIMEGRDIGTVIFPDANFKFFLSASAGVREERREREGQTDLVVQRDTLDAKRTTAPFVPADHSIRINTDTLDLQEVIDLVTGIILTGRVPGTITTQPFSKDDTPSASES